MKIIILSSFPLIDKNKYKIDFLENILHRNPKKIAVVYSHCSLTDHIYFLKKKIYDISFRNNSSSTVQINSILPKKSLSSIAKKYEIIIKKFKRFSVQECIEYIKKFEPDIIHNFSGEIVPKDILEISKYGVISGHYGKLPEIRGGDSPRWSILLNFPLFVTHMFLNDKLDMGDILRFEKVPIEKGDSLHSIRIKCQIANLNGHLELYDSIKRGKIIGIKQTTEEGHTYYRMGKYLRKKVEYILSNGQYIA